MSTFINPFTDFGFKKLFGVESALPRLKSFIEDALELTQSIRDLRFMSAEQLGSSDDERRAVYDIYCTADDGSHFIVELQRAKQHFFKDRTVFYASFPIRSQAQKGDWNYKLEPVYCLGILDFSFSDTDPLRWHHIVQLKDQDGKVFYNKLTFAFLELEKFTKTADECRSHLEYWCYMLRNMDGMSVIPDFLEKDPLMKSAFDEARFLGMSKEEQLRYEKSLKIYRDLTNVVDTAYDDGAATMKGERDKAIKSSKESQKREKEARKREKEERRQKEEERRQKEEERRQKELLKEKLIAAGMTEEDILKLLNG